MDGENKIHYTTHNPLATPIILVGQWTTINMWCVRFLRIGQFLMSNWHHCISVSLSLNNSCKRLKKQESWQSGMFSSKLNGEWLTCILKLALLFCIISHLGYAKASILMYVFSTCIILCYRGWSWGQQNFCECNLNIILLYCACCLYYFVDS